MYRPCALKESLRPTRSLPGNRGSKEWGSQFKLEDGKRPQLFLGRGGGRFEGRLFSVLLVPLIQKSGVNRCPLMAFKLS